MQVLAQCVEAALVWRLTDPPPGFTTPGIPANIQWELHGTGPVSTTSFSPDGTRILLASGQDVQIFDAESGVRRRNANSLNLHAVLSGVLLQQECCCSSNACFGKRLDEERC